jgi:hypothetical protein
MTSASTNLSLVSIPTLASAIASALVQGILAFLGSPLSLGAVLLVAISLAALFLAGEVRNLHHQPQATENNMTTSSRPRIRVTIPPKYPIQYATRLGDLVGSSVVHEISGESVAEIDNISTVDDGKGPGAIQLGLKNLSPGMQGKQIAFEIEAADPLEDPDLPGKWRVIRVLARA